MVYLPETELRRLEEERLAASAADVEMVEAIGAAPRPRQPPTLGPSPFEGAEAAATATPVQPQLRALTPAERSQFVQAQIETQQPGRRLFPIGEELRKAREGIGGFATWLQEATSARPAAGALGLEEEYEALPPLARTAADIAPGAVAAALAGGGPAALLRGLGPAGRVAAPLAEPILRAPLPARLAAEEAVGVATVEGGREVGERYGPAAGLLAGAGAGIVTAGGLTLAPRAGTAALRAAEQRVPGVATTQLRRHGVEAVAGGEDMILRGAFDIVPGDVEKQLATASKAKTGRGAISRSELEEQQAIYRALRDNAGDPIAALDELTARMDAYVALQSTRGLGPLASREYRKLPTIRDFNPAGAPSAVVDARAAVLERWLAGARFEPEAGRIAMVTQPEPTVGRARFTETGQVIEEPTFATEAELGGYRATQAPLMRERGVLPIETAGPMFQQPSAPARTDIQAQFTTERPSARAQLTLGFKSPTPLLKTRGRLYVNTAGGDQPVEDMSLRFLKTVEGQAYLDKIRTSTKPTAVLDSSGNPIAASPTWQARNAGLITAIPSEGGYLARYVDATGTSHYSREAFPTSEAAFAKARELKAAQAQGPPPRPPAAEATVHGVEAVAGGAEELPKLNKKPKPESISDFEVGVDQVIRRGNRIFVEKPGYAPVEVSNAEIVNLPTFRANAANQTLADLDRVEPLLRDTPYLSAEGRQERLSIIAERRRELDASAWAEIDAQRAATPPRAPFVPAAEATVRGVEAGGALTDDAAKLLDNLDKGQSAPAFISKNLEKIARDNGIEVTGDMTPNDVIARLRAMREVAPPSAGVIPEGAEAPVRGVPLPETAPPEITPRIAPSAATTPPGEAPAVAPLRSPAVELPPGGGAALERGLTERARTTEGLVSPAVRQRLDESIETYEQLGNRVAASEAAIRIVTDPVGARARVLDLQYPPDPVSISEGLQLFKQAEQAGNVDEADTLIRALAKKGTARGQEIQMFSTIDKMSPEGVFLEVHRTLQKYIAIKGEKVTLALEERLAQADAAVRVQEVKATAQKIVTDAKAEVAADKQTIAAIRKEAARADRAQKRQLLKRAEDLEVLTGRKIPEARTRARNYERQAINAARRLVSKKGVGLPDALANNLLDRAREVQGLPDGLQKTRRYEALMQDVRNLVPPSRWRTALDVLNIPRAMRSAWDMSYMLRQGWRTALTHPSVWARAWKPMIESMLDEDVAIRIMDTMATRPLANIAHWSGLDFLEFNTTLARGEEFFSNRLLGRVPGYRASERGFVVPGNKIRGDMFDNVVRRWFPEGTDFSQIKSLKEAAAISGRSEKEFTDLARVFNVMTGRGSVEWLKGNATILSPLFWSLRFAASRVEPYYMLAAGPLGRGATTSAARKELAMMLIGTWGTFFAVSKLGGMAGIWDSDLDPNGPHFGSVRFKGTNTWIDLTGGAAPFARLVARLYTGTTKTSSGEIVPLDRSDAAARFVTSLFAPIPSVLKAFADGQNFIGDKRDLRDPNDLLKGLLDLTTPLSLMNIAEGVWEDRLRGGLLTSPQLVGLGAQTYQTLTDVQNQETRAGNYVYQTGSRKGQKIEQYRDLNEGQQKEVRDSAAYQAELGRIEANRQEPGPREQAPILFRQHDRRKTELEADFKRDFIDAGVTGKTLREGISDLKANRYQAAQALLGDPQIQAYLDRNADKRPVEDTLAERYWSAEAPMVNGQPDFKARDATRQQILTESRRPGVSERYITGSGENTYRGKRFADPQVRAIVEQYEADMEMLRPYWEIADQVTPYFLRHMGFTGDTDNVTRDQFFAWLDQQLVAEARQKGYQGEQARAYANWNIERYERKFNEGLANAREEFRKANPEIARLLAKWEYLSPKQAAEQLIPQPAGVR